MEYLDALELAVVCQKLGAGRAIASDSIDHSVGFKLLVHQGSKVKQGKKYHRLRNLYQVSHLR